MFKIKINKAPQSIKKIKIKKNTHKRDLNRYFMKRNPVIKNILKHAQPYSQLKSGK